MENILGLCRVKCASTCDKVKCADPGCRTMICKYHAEGCVVLDDDEGCFVFHKVQFTDCERVVCDHHCDRFRDCNVCRNDFRAQVSLGYFDYPAVGASFSVCADCGNTCHKNDE